MQLTDAGHVACREGTEQAAGVAEVVLERRAVALAGGEADLPQRDAVDPAVAVEQLGGVEDAVAGAVRPRGHGYRQVVSAPPMSRVSIV